MKNKIITFCFLVVAALLAMSSSNGIANQNAAPGQNTCNSGGCHTSNALNSGGGSVIITDNIPATGYVPGQTYSINVIITKTGASLFGFGFEAVSSNNTNAGTLVVTNAASTKTLSGTRVNMTHLSNSGLTANTKTFSFNWIAPATPTGNVTFYAAGNAANANGNTAGDYIYTTNKSFGPNPIITGSITGSPFCGNSSGIAVPFIASGTFSTGNVFSAELSDATGSFASPLSLGSVTSTSSGTILTTAPLPNIAGTAYEMRVVSTLPALTGLNSVSILTIQAAPSVANAGTNQSVCGSSITLSANAPATGTGSWTVLSGTGVFSSATNPAASVTGLSAGGNVFRWTISNANCAASVSNVTITSFSAPSPATAGAAQTVCTNFVNLNAGAVTSGTGLWSVLTGTGLITSPNSASTSVTGLSSGINIFQWTVSNGPCVASSATVQVLFSGSITIANAGTDQTVCASSAQLTGNQAVNGTGTWTLISGAGTIVTPGSFSSAVTGLSIGNNVFRWVISNGACTPSTSDVTIRSVTVSPALVAANQTLCSTSGSLSAVTPVNGSGSWQVISGSASLSSVSSASSGFTNLSPGLNSFLWTISNAPCSANTATLSIIQNGTIGVADAGASQSVCSKTITMNASPLSIGSGTWSVLAGSGIFANINSAFSGINNLVSGLNMFRWTVGNGTCSPVFSDVSITSTTISPAVTGPNQTICSSSVNLSATQPTAGIGLWTLLSGTASINSPSSALSIANGLTVGNHVFRWTVSNAPCPPSVKDMTVSNCTTNSIITLAVPGSPFCLSTGYSVLVSFTSTGLYTGFYTAEISDANGSFTNAVGIGSGPGSPISAIVPFNLPVGTAYRIRVVNSNPAIAGSDNGVNLEVNNCDPNYIKVDSIAGSPFCENTTYQVSIPFTVGGNITPPFVAQLSDASGSFANPLSIGFSFNSPLNAVIPSAVAFGLNYKIRIRSSSSGVFSSVSKNNLSINSCLETSLSELSQTNILQFFPAIAQQELHVLSNAAQKSLNIRISDLSGRVLKQFELATLSAGTEYVIDISDLQTQLYFIQIQSNVGVLNGKFVKE